MPRSDGSQPHRSSTAGSSSESANLAHSQIARVGAGVVRSSSPAKRSRSELDGDGEEPDTYDKGMDIDGVDGVRRSPSKRANAPHLQSPLPNRTRPSSGVMDGQPVPRMVMTGEEDGEKSHTAESTSSDSAAVAASSPPSSVDTLGEDKVMTTVPSYDEQYRQVMQLVVGVNMTEGQKGYIVPMEWLLRVVARTTDGLKENHPKEAREGDVGPVNTRVLVPSSAASDLSNLKDATGNDFVPVKTGLRMTEDYEVFHEAAWDLMMKWYGIAEGAPTLTRFAHNTSVENEFQTNFQFEVYPPLFTIQKLSNEKGRGLESLADLDRLPVRLVASRSEPYQAFLKRVKQALSVPLKTKIQVWKILETLQTVPGRAGIPTPSSSRDPSPAPQSALAGDMMKLTIDLDTLKAMPEGTRRELLGFNDETMNEKYNGHLTIGQVGFPEAQNLIIEEKLRDTDGFATQSQAKSLATESSSANSKDQTSTAAIDRPSANTRSTRSSSPFVMSKLGRRDKRGRVRGSIGLSNLGNTCYMNSALQCIRSVEELTIYCLKEKYKNEINDDNPLGHHGQIAKSYSALVYSIFSSESSFSPRMFKNTLGRCQALFSGYGQQDSQEFLSFLLDGLHEDLNRVHKKPYIENPDSKDETVHDPQAIKELGETYRANYSKRNDSVIMDLFCGFYKNTMVCPICDKVSVTFDPYSQVTLQLPVENTFSHKVTMVPLRDIPQMVEVDLDRNGTIRTLKEYIAKRFPGVQASNLVVAEDYSSKFYKVFEDAEIISEVNIQSNDKLLVYELDDSPTNWPPTDKVKPKTKGFLNFSISSSNNDGIPDMSSPVADRMAVPVYQRVPNSRGAQGFTIYPFFVLITREEAKDYESIFRKVLLRIQNMTTKDIFSNCETTSGQQSDTDAATEEDDGPKVQAKSIEGDEDLVDVSMTSGTDNPRSGDFKRSSKRQSKILDQRSTFIDPELRNFFEIGVYNNGQSEVIPTGWSIVNESSKFPLLRERTTRQPRRRPSTSSWSGRKNGSRRNSRNGRWPREASSGSDTEDELTKSEVGLKPSIVEPGDAESDEDESLSQNTSPTRKKGFKRSGSRFKANINKIGNSLRRSKSRSNAKEDYVLRLGEGLVLDWSLNYFESLFLGEGPDDLKGQRSDLEIATVPDPDLDATRAKRNARKKQGVSLDECFAETARSEILSEDNTWYCNRCKEMRRASKTLELWTVPDILVVHLKRFASQSRMRDKIDILVDFPVEDMDLSGKVGMPEGKSLKYDLFAVDNHYGGLGGGHYTSVAQNFLDKEWYDYNDSMVSKSTGAHAVSKAAYLLFYRRRQDTSLGPPYLQEVVRSAYSDSRPSSPSGKDQQDDPPSYNESSHTSSAPGPNISRTHDSNGILGGAGGTQQDDHFDEAIDMGADDALPGLEDSQSHQQPMFGPPSWSFGSVNKGGMHAPPGSENGMNDADSLDGAGSARGALGGDLDARMEEDFPHEGRGGFVGGGQMAHLPPGLDGEGDEDEAFVEHIGVDDQGVDDEKVAEVRLSDEEGP